MRQYGAIQIPNEDKSLDHELASHPSSNPNPEDHLTPCFDCPCQDRPSNVFIGTFNLIASIVGGVSFHEHWVLLSYISMITSNLKCPYEMYVYVFDYKGSTFATNSLQ